MVSKNLASYQIVRTIVGERNVVLAALIGKISCDAGSCEQRSVVLVDFLISAAHLEGLCTSTMVRGVESRIVGEKRIHNMERLVERDGGQPFREEGLRGEQVLYDLAVASGEVQVLILCGHA